VGKACMYLRAPHTPYEQIHRINALHADSAQQRADGGGSAAVPGAAPLRRGARGPNSLHRPAIKINRTVRTL